MSSSSSSSSDDDDEDDCRRSRLDDSIAEEVYNLPKRLSEFGRDALPSVFEESDHEKTVNSNPVAQKVQVSNFRGIQDLSCRHVIVALHLSSLSF